jgi:DNA-binding LacI/PurR family transcriptional regulator
LTTVSQPGAEIGRVAMTLLLRILTGQPIDDRRILLPTHLVLRSSTAQIE